MYLNDQSYGHYVLLFLPMICLCFVENCEICNFPDDNTLYGDGMELFSILENLKHDTKIILNWFRINSLKIIPWKFQFMILGKNKTTKVMQWNYLELNLTKNAFSMSI